MLSSDKHHAQCILQINTLDTVGGAAKIAWMLHQAYRNRGYDAYLAVGDKHSEDPATYRIDNEAYWAFWLKWARWLNEWNGPLPTRVQRFFLHFSKIHRRMAKKSGRENFYFPGSRRILHLPPRQPDIVHGHNLHGLYFDLRTLPRLSSRVPVLLTLHDAWMLSGYCAYSFDCERWQTGCAHCPYIRNFPVQRDATADNWRRKQRIYAKSRLYIATPSRWLLNRVEQSILAPAVIEGRVIYNGMDFSNFYPTETTTLRAKLHIPAGTPVILATAAKILQDTRKDFETMKAAVLLLGEKLGKPVHFLALGGEHPREQVGNVTIQYIPFQQDEEMVAQYYQAADVYIHAAKADNLPNTIIEALACGTPVVATAVGGIPEQIEDGENGFLVASKSPEDMAAAVQTILQNSSLHNTMRQKAAITARRRFDVNRMVDEYLQWYHQILSSS